MEKWAISEGLTELFRGAVELGDVGEGRLDEKRALERVDEGLGKRYRLRKDMVVVLAVDFYPSKETDHSLLTNMFLPIAENSVQGGWSLLTNRLSFRHFFSLDPRLATREHLRRVNLIRTSWSIALE